MNFFNVTSFIVLFLLNFQNGMARKSFFEHDKEVNVKHVTEYDFFKLYSQENLNMCNEKLQKLIYLDLLNITGEENTALSLKQKSLVDQLNRSEMEETNLAENLKTCQERENELNLQLTQSQTDNVQHIEQITNILTVNLKILYIELLPLLVGTPYPGFEKYTTMSTARLGLMPLVHSESFMHGCGTNHSQLNLEPIVNDIPDRKYEATVPSCDKNPTKSRSMLIVVLSSPGNFEKRTKIRETWKNHIDIVKRKGLVRTINFAFVLGQTELNSIQIRIKKEMATFKDIIQISELIDSPQNQTLKMVEVLKWTNTNCPKIHFLIKVNDDMYVNVHYLSFFVKSYYRIGKMTIYGDSTNINYDNRLKIPNNNGPKKSNNL